MLGKKLAFIDQDLEDRRGRGRLRRLRQVRQRNGAVARVDGRDLVNFCSNDYLGLSQHPLLKQRAVSFLEEYGPGVGASRLVCGNLDCFQRVEGKLAALKKTEEALIFPTGFQANISLLPAMTDARSLIFSDRLNHNSLIQGARLSPCPVLIYGHNDLSDLERLLKESQKGKVSRRLIVTESVFSMDGDRSDLAALSFLAEKYQALLMVDEAHAFGLLGEKGLGLARGQHVDLAMGTFSKAAGCLGGYVACSARIKEYLINYCAGLIYSTGTSPAVLGAVDAALDLIPTMETERNKILASAAYLRDSLQGLDFDTGDSTTQIVPVIIGGEEQTMNLSQKLEENGFWSAAIRPPTVPEEQSRLRLTLSALHTREQIDGLLRVLEQLR